MGVLDVFFVAGEPDNIERAADAWRGLADSLTLQSGILSGIAGSTLASWSKGRARTSYKGATTKLKTGYADYAADLREVATALDDIANEIRDAKREAASLRIMVAGAVAAGVGLAVFTFGTSAAASTATVTTATVTMGVLLRTLAVRIGAAIARMWKVTQMPRWGMGLSLAATVGFKGAEDIGITKGPGLGSWSKNDVSNILLGGVLASGMGLTAAGLGGRQIVQRMFGTGRARRIAVNGAAGFGGAGTGTAINQFGFNRQRLDDPQAWKTTAKVAGIAATFGGLNRVPLKVKPLSRTQRPAGHVFPPMKPSDYGRQLTGLPTGVTVVIFKDEGTGERVNPLLSPSPFPKPPGGRP